MEKIGRFEIIGKLGRGAFGMVYKGRDPVINRLAAIKVMSEATVGDPELVSRFKREAEAAGGLQHRNIVTIYDLGEHGGLPYIAMEYLEGKDLERLLKERADLPVDRKIDIVAQVAEGLHYAHTKGVVHRDIKPANIRLLDDGTVKIMDFGIAKMSSSDMTRTGQFMGTVNYMSPEQIKAKKIDGRSDLFAVGVVFYEFLSYRRPFPGDSITAVIYKIVNENPPPLQELQGTPYEWLEGVVFKCLEKDANKRWASCEELAQALRNRQKVAVDVGESPIEMTINFARQKAEAGDLDAALRQLDEVLEHDPENSTVLKHRRQFLATRILKTAEGLVASGRLEQARDEVVRAIREVGETDDLTRALAGIETRIKAAEAERLFERASRSLGEKRYEAAIELLEQAQGLDPYNEKVKSALTRAVDEKRRDDVQELLAEAKVHLERGQLDEARARAGKALELDPASREARAMLQAVDREREAEARRTGVADAVLQANLALKKEEFDRALAIVEKALALEPKNAELQQLLSRAKQEKVRGDERRAVIEFTTHGKQLLAQKKFDEALLQFQKALKLDPAWPEAQLGARAAQARVPSIDDLQKRKVPAGLLAGIGIAAVVVAAVLGWVLTRPTEARKSLVAADEAQAAGKLADAARLYLTATERPGKEPEHAQAREKYAALYEPLVAKEQLLDARAVLDQIGKWQGSEAVRGRYRELAQALARRGVDKGEVALMQGAAATYQEYFRPGYEKLKDYDTIKEMFQFGEKVLARAEDRKTGIDDRVALYALSQEIFTYVDGKEVGLNAFSKANDARASRTEVAAKKDRIDAFNRDVETLVQRAQAAEADPATYPQALESYREIRKLVAQNQDVADLLDLARFEEIASGGERALSQRLAERAAAASAAERVALLVGQAESAEKSGNLRSAIAAYEEVLKADSGNATARESIRRLQSTVARVDALKDEIREALKSRDLAAAESRFNEASSLVPADTDLAGFQAELARLKRGAEEEARVAADFRAAEELFRQNKLGEAEAKYKQIASASSDRAVIERANRAVEEIRLKAVEAQIAPKVEAARAAEAQGNLQAALQAWREVERLNSSYPGLREKLAELNRAINKERIAALEKSLEAAWAGGKPQNPAALDKAMRDLEALDSANPKLAEVRQQMRAAQESRERALKAAQDALSRRDPDAAQKALAGLPAGEADVKGLLGQVQALRNGLAALRAAESALGSGNLAEARSRAESARSVPALSADAERILRDVEARGRAAAATSVPPERTPVPAAPPAATVRPAAPAADVAALVAAGEWIKAAEALAAAGGGADPALAGRVYFNASYTAACRQEPCDFATAQKWALEAGKYDDTASGTRLTNPRWAKTFANFKQCDLQLKTLCGAARPK